MKLRGKIAGLLTLPFLGAAVLFPSGCMNGSIADGIASLRSGATNGSTTSLDDLTDIEIYVDPIAVFYRQETIYDTLADDGVSGYIETGLNVTPSAPTNVKMIFHLENAIKSELGATLASQVLAALPSSTTLQTIQVTINFNDLYTWTFDLGDAVANSRWQTLMVIDSEGTNRFVQTATPLFSVQDETTAIENETGIFMFGGMSNGAEVNWVTMIPTDSDTVYSSQDTGGAYVLSALTQADGYPVVIPTDTTIYGEINSAWPLVGAKMSADVMNHFIIVHAKDNALSGGTSTSLYDNYDVESMTAYTYDDALSTVNQYFICSSTYNAGGVSPYRCNRTVPAYSAIFDNAAAVFDGLNGALSIQINGSSSSNGLWDLATPGFGAAGSGTVYNYPFSSDDGTTLFEVL